VVLLNSSAMRDLPGGYHCRRQGLSRSAHPVVIVAQMCYNSREGAATMPTTTIRIDDGLKERIAAAAVRAGKTPHAFIVDTIAETVEQTELDEAFHRLADKRWANVLASGKTVAWDEAKAWVEARARGERRPRPAARKPHR
jgi:predicted transcriptional regulator